MATFEATTHPLAFAHMEGGVKTVYVTPNLTGISDVTSGDRIEFADLGSITIGTVRRYASLEELMEKEGYANVVPEADDTAHALRLLRGSSEWDENAAAAHGVLALRVRSAKRKA
jgi:ASC-1-like (ASCH) protein